MQKPTHIITAFDEDLNELNNQVQKLGRLAAVSYTHLTLPTNREV